MGWAKYYEDNVSIYFDRMYMREDSSLYRNNMRENREIKKKENAAHRLRNSNGKDGSR